MEIHCNITEILNIDKENHKKNRFYHPERVNVKPEGILNNVELYFSNEPARHKLLDLIGDQALLGTRLKAGIIAVKPGHYINTEFVKKLRKEIKSEQARRVFANILPVETAHFVTYKNVLGYNPPIDGSIFTDMSSGLDSV